MESMDSDHEDITKASKMLVRLCKVKPTKTLEDLALFLMSKVNNEIKNSSYKGGETLNVLQTYTESFNQFIDNLTKVKDSPQTEIVITQSTISNINSNIINYYNGFKEDLRKADDENEVSNAVVGFIKNLRKVKKMPGGEAKANEVRKKIGEAISSGNWDKFGEYINSLNKEYLTAR